MNRKKQSIKFYIYFMLTIVCMCAIFAFSAQEAEESSHTSEAVLQWSISLSEKWSLEKWIFWGTHSIRKIAHFLIYTALGICTYGIFYEYKGCASSEKKKRIRKSVRFAWIFSTLYAMTDEFHQLFVQGRAAQITDVMIDSVGALCGIGLIVFIRWMIKRICVIMFHYEEI